MPDSPKKSDGPMRIQLALQGGGAKIAGLIAAMEAVQKLERDGVIRVTRIAGTSAGSIVGTLFAAGVPMQVLRSAIESVPLEPFTKKRSSVRLYRRAYRGRPIFPEEALQKELRKLFDQIDADALELDTIGSLNRKFQRNVHLTATDLQTKGLRESNEDSGTISSILDSCALPILFRGYKSPQATVLDGGICENLPTELLYPYEDSDGPVIALSFAPKHDVPPSNFKEYLLALIETVTNRSLDRARKKIPGRIHAIRTNIGTLDFKEAFDPDYRNGEHGAIRARAELFFRNLADAENRTQTDDAGKTSGELLSDVTDPGYAVDSAEAVMMRRIWRIQMALRSDASVVFTDYEMSVIAHSLNLDENYAGQTLDEVRTSMQMTTRNAPAWGYGFKVSSAAHETVLYQNECRVLKNGEEDVLAAVLPMANPDMEDPSQNSLGFFFKEPLMPDMSPFDIRFVDTIDNFAQPLRATGKDKFWISTRNATGECSRIILHIPTSFGDIGLTSRCCPEGEIKPISNKRLAHAETQRPMGYKTYGWECSGLKPGERFEIEVEKVSND